MFIPVIEVCCFIRKDNLHTKANYRFTNIEAHKNDKTGFPLVFVFFLNVIIVSIKLNNIN